ncbi:hypothetical protein RBSWK_06335 [Rhodopirellula baltica SWK14]|uniref:Uncharacterized protein n=1 Tax=Rhodopirellula baltica SWK14 TaxID=993516 RepID=L7C9C8_RHOBT|nr:hypothetical protein RBSWK_06335 [Rhodopirellula baltica SWK14]
MPATSAPPTGKPAYPSESASCKQMLLVFSKRICLHRHGDSDKLNTIQPGKRL